MTLECIKCDTSKVAAWHLLIPYFNLPFYFSLKLMLNTPILSFYVKDKLRLPAKVHSDNTHLQLSVSWLCKCFTNAGFSEGYSLEKGWLLADPGGAGLAIQTFLEYASYTGKDKYSNVATEIGDWICSLQLPTSALGSCFMKLKPMSSLDAGNVILGLCALYKETSNEKYIASAIKIADWFVQKHNKIDIPRDGEPLGCDAHLAWSLLTLNNINKNKNYSETTARIISLLISSAKPNGWLNSMASYNEAKCSTLDIAYTLQGILECSFYLEEKIRGEAIDVIITASAQLMRKYELKKKDPYSLPDHLPSCFNSKWKPESMCSSSSGSAQVAYLWLSIFKENNDARFLNAALKVNDQLKALQVSSHKSKAIYGGLKENHPIWHGRHKYTFTALAAAHFARSLVLQEKIMATIEK
ncbi:MAG: hypothetical protein EOO43_05525 [Flavobacterium sp.]|nr:MAG: hypothetical protein EOO43_05525 [Flavobacterium sp.]